MVTLQLLIDLLHKDPASPDAGLHPLTVRPCCPSQLLLDLLKTQPQQTSSGAGGGSAAEAVTELAADLLSRLQPQFDLELAERRFPLRYEESMNTVLKQVGIAGG